MNDKPEVPRSGSDTPPEGTPTDGTPTVNIGGSYSSQPYSTSPMPGTPPETPGAPPRDPYSWQPGQYSPGAGNPAGSNQVQPQHYAPPPHYNPTQYAQGQSPQYTPPQSGGYPQHYNPQQPTYPQQTQYPAPYGYVQPKDPTVGLLLELIGYVGFLGIGHIWAGKTSRGIALLVGWWIYWALVPFLVFVLIGCLMIPLGLIIPLASGWYLKNEMEREQSAMGFRR